MTDDPVDPNQQDDDGGGGRRPTFPGGGGGGGIMSLSARIEVAVGEGDIEGFHARGVLKDTAANAVADRHRHALVEGGEVAQPRHLNHGLVNDVLQLIDNTVNGGG